MPKSSIFKACRSCKALVLPDQDVCPICGGTSFTEEWEGMVIILNENSELTSIIGAKKPWRYAINIK